jgi:hypothetical protein
LQQNVDSKCPPISYRRLFELDDYFRSRVNVFGDFRLVPAAERIVVGHMALVLHVDEHDCEGSDIRRELPDSMSRTLRPNASMLQCPVGLSPRWLAPARATLANERVCTAPREAMKQGVVGGAYRPSEIRLPGCAYAGFKRASSSRDKVTRGQGAVPIQIS